MRFCFGNLADGSSRSKVACLVEAARKPDREALDALVMHVRPRVARFARKMTRDPSLAEVMVQEVMYALVEALPRFDLNREFSPWFETLMRNTVIDELRRRNRRQEVLTDPALMPEPDPSIPSYTETLALKRALEALPEELAQAVLLHDYDGLTFKEIGRLTGISQHTWNSRHRRARKLLKDILGESW